MSSTGRQRQVEYTVALSFVCACVGGNVSQQVNKMRFDVRVREGYLYVFVGIQRFSLLRCTFRIRGVAAVLYFFVGIQPLSLLRYTGRMRGVAAVLGRTSLSFSCR